MKYFKTLTLTLVLSLHGCGSSSSNSGSSPSAVSFAGTYSGQEKGTQDGIDFVQNIEFVLTQSGNNIGGTWISEIGGSGTLSGTVSGMAITDFKIVETDANCPGSYVGSAILSSGSLNGTVAGTTECGTVSASFTADK